MERMRNLERSAQVTFWSTPEIRAVLESLVTEARHRWRLRLDHPVKQQDVLNALVLYVCSLEEAERRRVVTDGLERLHALLNTDADAELDADASLPASSAPIDHLSPASPQAPKAPPKATRTRRRA